MRDGLERGREGEKKLGNKEKNNGGEDERERGEKGNKEKVTGLVKDAGGSRRRMHEGDSEGDDRMGLW